MIISKFVPQFPTHQNAVDLFDGKWACDLSELQPDLRGGPAPLFKQDSRPRQMQAYLCDLGLSLCDMEILEIGPLEGAHTYQLEELGAKAVLAIESNSEAYLKCLIVKEIAGLKRSRFLLGNAQEHLASAQEGIDLIFCSGVLYHMADPCEFIRLMCKATKWIYVWTHIFDSEFIPSSVEGDRHAVSVERYGERLTYYQRNYGDMGHKSFLGGVEQVSSWITLDDMTKCFAMNNFELTNLIVEKAHFNGPAVSFLAKRVIL